MPETTPSSPLLTDQEGDPALLDWQHEVPVSTTYGDVYYSRDDGLQESRYVFLDHNALTERWSQWTDKPGAQFTVGETGFGTGLNFLVAWQRWREFGFRYSTLHFVSVEKFPLTADSLRRAHARWPELATLSSRLCSQLPLPYPGIHRRCFDAGRVMLTLLHGDAAECLESLPATIDAWFLDGFAPSRNPDLWSPRVFQAMVKHSHVGTTFATFTSATQVRRDLQAAGFSVNKERGYGRKREMCCGTLLSINSAIPPAPAQVHAPEPEQKPGQAPDDGGQAADNVRQSPDDDQPPTDHDRQAAGETGALRVSCAPWFTHRREPASPRTAVVIGAGLAGCAAANALAMRGLRVTVLDAAREVASAASGNPVGLTFVRFTAHASAQNRYYLAAYLHALAKLRDVFVKAGIPEGEDWRLNGILRVFDDADEQADVDGFFATAHAHWLARPLCSATLSALAGFEIDRPGIIQPGSGWLNPARLCQALLTHPLIKTVLQNPAISLRQNNATVSGQGCHWMVDTPKGPHHADIVILANSKAASEFDQTRHLTLHTVRGQITRLVPSKSSLSLEHAINYSGYLTPVWQGFHTVGATFHPKRYDIDEAAADHVDNITRLRAALPGFPALPARDDGEYGGRVAFRAGTPDYLPYVGPAPDVDAYRECYQDGLGKGQLKRRYPPGPWHSGLYVNAGHGSRGITSTLLAAEVLCHWIFDEPAPVDTEMLHALHPGRFLVRNFRRRQSAPSAT